MSASTELYFFGEAGGSSREGPVPSEAFSSLLSAGYVTRATLVWSPLLAAWTPLGAVPVLAAQANALGGAAPAAPVAAPAPEAAPAPPPRAKRQRAPDADGNEDDGSGGKAFDARAEGEVGVDDDDDGGGDGGDDGEEENDAGEGEGEGEAEEATGDGAAGASASAGSGNSGTSGAATKSGALTAAGKRKRKRKNQRRAAPAIPWVYVTGLPPDVTEVELAEHFKRAGILKADAVTGAPRIRIYREQAQGGIEVDAGAGAAGAGADAGSSSSSSSSSSVVASAAGAAKGDASICFLKPESVELAVQLLDGAELRPGTGGFPLEVQPAAFEKKERVAGAGGAGGAGGGGGGGGADGGAAAARAGKGGGGGARGGGVLRGAGAAGLTPLEQAARVRALEQQVRLGWADEGDEEAAGSSGLCIVVLRNLFGAAEAAAPGFVADLCADVAPELEARCGALAKLTVFPRHAEGVAVAKFRTPGAAAACLEAMHGRFFGGRRLVAQFWDGVEDFTHRETEAESSSREASFGAFLMGGGPAGPADAAGGAR